jgi:pSer/pThr/pTyr-binding forkhead associated (FHA) protein
MEGSDWQREGCGEVGSDALLKAEPACSDADIEQSHWPSGASEKSTAAPSSVVRAIEPELLLADSSARPLQVFVSGPGDAREKEFTITEPTTLCGRGSQCDLVLRHADVSHRHALFQRAGDKLLFVDLCSRLGVIHNGEKRLLGWFAPGDRLMIGPYALHRPELPAQSSTEGVFAAPEQLFRRQAVPADASSRLALRVSGGPGGKTVDLPLERPITFVGRASNCKLRLHDESVSRMHAGIFLSQEGVFAVDLQRRSRLTINGRTVKRARLELGDELQVGRYRLQLIGGAGPLVRKGDTFGSAAGLEANNAHDRIAVEDHVTGCVTSPVCEIKETAVKSPPEQQAAFVDEVRESAVLVLAAEPPRALSTASAAAQPSIGDALGLAIFGALADLQQQFDQFQREQQERTQQQMEMMLRAMESTRVGLREEILSELRALRLIADELHEAQQAAVAERRAALTLESRELASGTTLPEPPAAAVLLPADLAAPAAIVIESHSQAAQEARASGFVDSGYTVSKEEQADDELEPSSIVKDSLGEEPSLEGAELAHASIGTNPQPCRKAAAGTAPADSLDLAQRIAKLQRERASRWTRLMQLIGGAG